MIRTITLNPAVDKTIEINDFKIDTVNRVMSVRQDAGGKGINVSKIIKTLGGESKAFGILAGKNGQYIKDYLDSEGIENDFLFVKGETRTNLKVVDMLQHTNTDINEPGVDVTPEDIINLENKIFEGIDSQSIIVLSGSVPSSIPKNIYRKWIEESKKYGAKVILDADGELLQEGIKAGPYLVKPNIHELEKLMNIKIESVDEAVGAAKSLLKLGIEYVVVSLGGEGAVYVRKDAVICAKGIKVNVRSTVGAGDSMVAALTLSLDKGYSFERSVTLSSASGTVSVTTSGTQAPDFEDILRYEKQVCYRYIK
jgi:1-phosphofructokinase